MEHPKTVKGFDGTLDDLAREIENMDYEAFQEFLSDLNGYVKRRADADKAHERPKLATELNSAASELKSASFYVGRAAEICKKYNEEKQAEPKK